MHNDFIHEEILDENITYIFLMIIKFFLNF